MEFTKEQKKEAYKGLTDEQKEFVGSEKITETLQSIGKKNGLLIDAIGRLGDTVFLALLGLIKSAEVGNAVRKAVSVGDAQYESIIRDLNEQIFIPYRGEMLSSPTETKKEESSEPSRDAILSEIENPAPTVHPISAADQSDKMITRDFIASKLSETVSLPAQKTAMALPGATPFTAPSTGGAQTGPAASIAQTAPAKTKSYAADPYREPIS
jgi:hypothetical protein